MYLLQIGEHEESFLVMASPNKGKQGHLLGMGNEHSKGRGGYWLVQAQLENMLPRTSHVIVIRPKLLLARDLSIKMK